MFGPKCARIVRRKLEAARVKATAQTGTEAVSEPTASRTCAFCPTDVSGLPDAMVCEQCSGKKSVCQRCKRKLGIKRERVQQAPRTQPTGPRAASAPPHPLVLTAPRNAGKTGHTAQVAAELGLKVVTPPQPPTHEEVALRAYFIWEASGYTHGHDQDDWARAYRELTEERLTALRDAA